MKTLVEEKNEEQGFEEEERKGESEDEGILLVEF